MNIKTKLSKYIFALLITTLALFLATPSLAAPSHARFVIDALDVHIVVRDDNSYLVTKTYDVTFTKHTSEISKYLPYRPRGSQENPVEIREISAGGRRFKIFKGKSIRIPIQDAYRGKKERIILSYTYDAGDDGHGMNVLRYNLVGGIRSYLHVNKLTFTIEMPHPFDTDRIGVTIRPRDSIDMGGSPVIVSDSFENDLRRRLDKSRTDVGIAEWQVDGTVITGQLNNIIMRNEDVAVTLQLPSGYYTTAVGRVHAEPDMPTKLPGYFVGLAAFISYLLWYFFGRERKITPIASIFPPKGMTPVDVGHVMNGQFKNKYDFISLMVYWAEKGYLNVSEVIGKKELQLNKVHDPNVDAKHYEKNLFNEIFKNENTVQAVSSIRYTINILNAYLNKKGRKSQLFSREELIMLLVGLPSLIGLWGFFYNQMETKAVALFFTFFLVIVFFATIQMNKRTGKKLFDRIFYRIFSGIFFTIMLSSIFIQSPIFTEPSILKKIQYILEMADLLLPLYLVTKCTTKMRTKTERENIARLEGFKNSLGYRSMYGSAGSQEYFYHVLPYAMVLCMTDALVKKFEHVALYPPKWYKSSSPEKTISASSFVSRLLEGL